jgi:hypothetical protein
MLEICFIRRHDVVLDNSREVSALQVSNLIRAVVLELKGNTHG